MFDGRFRPAAILIIKKTANIDHNESTKDEKKSIMLITNMENIIVCRWVNMDEIKPERTEPIKTPRDPIMKMEPAWLLLRSRSLTTTGIRGANIKRLMKAI